MPAVQFHEVPAPNGITEVHQQTAQDGFLTAGVGIEILVCLDIVYTEFFSLPHDFLYQSRICPALQQPDFFADGG